MVPYMGCLSFLAAVLFIRGLLLYLDLVSQSVHLSICIKSHYCFLFYILNSDICNTKETFDKECPMT